MISVIIITYNRRQLLRECLESLLNQKTDETPEIIVIDNFSSDQTDKFILRQFGNRITFIKNTKRLSLWEAKNKGIQASLGDIIAFIDDDCLAPEHWLEDIKKSLKDFDFTGGATYALPDIRFPWWWRKSLEWLIGINTSPNHKFLPLGSNLAFHRYVLEKILMNNQNWAPQVYLPYGEDNYRVRLALEHNFTMKIDMDLTVYHQFSTKRLSLGYLITRGYQQGKTTVSYKNSLKDLFSSLIALPYNFTMLLCFLDINRLFRIISNAAYILYYLKQRLKAILP